jgi:hypothetical protein
MRADSALSLEEAAQAHLPETPGGAATARSPGWTNASATNDGPRRYRPIASDGERTTRRIGCGAVFES